MAKDDKERGGEWGTKYLAKIMRGILRDEKSLRARVLQRARRG